MISETRDIEVFNNNSEPIILERSLRENLVPSGEKSQMDPSLKHDYIRPNPVFRPNIFLKQ